MVYLLTWVYEDSSTGKFLVEANSVTNALNAILNNHRITRQPKFVVVETPDIIANDMDSELVSEVVESELDGCNVVKFHNKLTDIVECGGVKLSLGSVLHQFDQYLVEKGDHRVE